MDEKESLMQTIQTYEGIFKLHKDFLRKDIMNLRDNRKAGDKKLFWGSVRIVEGSLERAYYWERMLHHYTKKLEELK